MMNLTISHLAREGGVGVETVRYYQRRGLMQEPAPASGVRRYGEADARRLRFIRSAQTAGFTLDEIGQLLTLDATNDRGQARRMARARVEALDEKIAELQMARLALSRLADQCGASGKGPCPVLLAFEA